MMGEKVSNSGGSNHYFLLLNFSYEADFSKHDNCRDSHERVFEKKGLSSGYFPVSHQDRHFIEGHGREILMILSNFKPKKLPYWLYLSEKH